MLHYGGLYLDLDVECFRQVASSPRGALCICRWCGLGTWAMHCPHASLPFCVIADACTLACMAPSLRSRSFGTYPVALLQYMTSYTPAGRLFQFWIDFELAKHCRMATQVHRVLSDCLILSHSNLHTRKLAKFQLGMGLMCSPETPPRHPCGPMSYCPHSGTLTC